MKPDPASRTRKAVEVATVLARWLLGALFLYMGLNKALHPVAFLKLLRQYEMLQSPVLLNSVAAVLPWFEVFCGLLLLAGVAVRGTALIVILMLVPMTLMVLDRALALQAAQAIPFCALSLIAAVAPERSSSVGSFLKIAFSSRSPAGCWRAMAESIAHVTLSADRSSSSSAVSGVPESHGFSEGSPIDKLKSS